MKLKLRIYDNGVIMLVMFLQDIQVEELLPFGYQNVHEYFCSKPKSSKQLKRFRETYTEYI